MRWYVLAISGYLALTLDLGLRGLLTFGPVAPNWLFVLAVYAALLAPGRAAIWAALLLGTLTDLTSLYPPDGPGAPLVLIGPSALGYAAAAAIVVRARTMLYRKSPASLAVLVLLSGLAAQLIIVGLLTARGLPWLLNERIAGWDVARPDRQPLPGLAVHVRSCGAAGVGFVCNEGVVGVCAHAGDGAGVRGGRAGPVSFVGSTRRSYSAECRAYLFDPSSRR